MNWSTAFALMAAALVGGAAGAYIAYRVYAPKMEKRFRQSLEDAFAGHRLDAKHDRQHDKTEMLKLLLDAVERHAQVAAIAEFATLQEQVDALTQDAAEALDGSLDSRITNIVTALLAAKPAEAKMDGVSTDNPDAEDDADRRQATGGRFHM